MVIIMRDIMYYQNHVEGLTKKIIWFFLLLRNTI